jgi:hypothetical protein
MRLEVKMASPVRWNLKVSRDTDLSLRTYLGSRGMKKGDLSKFVEEAVRWRIFDQTVQKVKQGFAQIDAVEGQAMIDQAVAEVRRERRKSA